MEGRRSHKQGNKEQVGGEPALLSARSTANAKAPQTLQVVHARKTSHDSGTSAAKSK